jgi:hypothetical protein
MQLRFEAADHDEAPVLDNLSLADFQPLLQSRLTFRAADGEFELELAEATLLNQPSPRPQPPFRLILRSAQQLRLPQGAFELQHPTHGPLVVFMVPLQPDALGPSYELIFN